MTAHTPGRWRFNSDFAEVQATGGETLVAYPATSTSTRFDGTSLGVPDWDEMVANGRLLAAAPELLAALKFLVAACEREGWDESDIDMMMARAAIAKVEDRDD